jgi:hypothetical protein
MYGYATPFSRPWSKSVYYPEQQLETVKDHLKKIYCSFFHQLIFNIYDLIFIIYVPVERRIRRNITLSDDISLGGQGAFRAQKFGDLRRGVWQITILSIVNVGVSPA